eukprot:ANDGO_01973.mRNA.1 hypothetical protein
MFLRDNSGSAMSAIDELLSACSNEEQCLLVRDVCRSLAFSDENGSVSSLLESCCAYFLFRESAAEEFVLCITEPIVKCERVSSRFVDCLVSQLRECLARSVASHMLIRPFLISQIREIAASLSHPKSDVFHAAVASDLLMAFLDASPADVVADVSGVFPEQVAKCVPSSIAPILECMFLSPVPPVVDELVRKVLLDRFSTLLGSDCENACVAVLRAISQHLASVRLSANVSPWHAFVFDLVENTCEAAPFATSVAPALIALVSSSRTTTVRFLDSCKKSMRSTKARMILSALCFSCESERLECLACLSGLVMENVAEWRHVVSILSGVAFLSLLSEQLLACLLDNDTAHHVVWRKTCCDFLASVLLRLPFLSRSLMRIIVNRTASNVGNSQFLLQTSPLCVLMDVLEASFGTDMFADSFSAFGTGLLQLITTCTDSALPPLFSAISVLCRSSISICDAVLLWIRKSSAFRQSTAMMRCIALARVLVVDRVIQRAEDAQHIQSWMMAQHVHAPCVRYLCTYSACYISCSGIVSSSPGNSWQGTSESKMVSDLSRILSFLSDAVRTADRGEPVTRICGIDIPIPSVFDTLHRCICVSGTGCKEDVVSRLASYLVDRRFLQWVYKQPPSVDVFRVLCMSYSLICAVLLRSTEMAEQLVLGWYLLGKCTEVYRPDYPSLCPPSFVFVHPLLFRKLVGRSSIVKLLAPDLSQAWQASALAGRPLDDTVGLDVLAFAYVSAGPLFCDHLFMDARLASLTFEVYLITCRWWWSSPETYPPLSPALVDVARNLNPHFMKEILQDCASVYQTFRGFLIDVLRYSVCMEALDERSIPAPMLEFLGYRLFDGKKLFRTSDILTLCTMALVQEVQLNAGNSVLTKCLDLIESATPIFFENAAKDVLSIVSVLLSLLQMKVVSHILVFRRVCRFLIAYASQSALLRFVERLTFKYYTSVFTEDQQMRLIDELLPLVVGRVVPSNVKLVALLFNPENASRIEHCKQLRGFVRSLISNLKTSEEARLCACFVLQCVANSTTVRLFSAMRPYLHDFDSEILQSLSTSFSVVEPEEPTPRKKKRLRSQNPWVDANLAHEDGTDSYHDLDDFVVVSRKKTYSS